MHKVATFGIKIDYDVNMHYNNNIKINNGKNNDVANR